MTPAQLAVERDALLSGGRTMEEVARMQAAADGKLALRVAVRVQRLLMTRLEAYLHGMDGLAALGVSRAIHVIGQVDLAKTVESFESPTRSCCQRRFLTTDWRNLTVSPA